MIITKEQYLNFDFTDVLAAMATYNKMHGVRFKYNAEMETLLISDTVKIPNFNSTTFKFNFYNVYEHFMTNEEFKQETLKGNTDCSYTDGRFLF